MRGLSWALALLIVLLQYPLWLGKGSWFRVWELQEEIRDQQRANLALEARNAQLVAEAHDLHSGYDALEGRARFELGMLRANEVFIHVIEPGAASAPREESNNQ